MNQIPRYVLVLSLTVPLALIAASCGSSDSADQQPTSTSSVTSAPPSPTQAETTTTTSAPTPTTQTPQATTSVPTATTQEPQMLIDSVVTGGFHSCALMRSGSISCWGSNFHGQLGNGPEEDDYTPLPVEVVGIDDATAVAEGGWHTCALRRTGEVFCWGSNWIGQLGNGESTGDPEDTSENSPVPIKTLDKSDITTIEAGGLHTCALHQDGTISCWGSNSFGELGANTNSSLPVKVTGISDATAIAVGGWNTCALHQDGTISCWGSNAYGELGNGQSTGDPDDTSADSSLPVKVTGISDATAIEVGGWHVCALHQTGEVSCWGRNRRGELGNGRAPEEMELSDLPVKVVGISNAIAVTAGGDHTCALHQDGTVSCWGSNSFGELGNGQATGNPDDTSTDSPIPVKVVGISNAMAISTGGNHVCALLRTDEIACWGDNRIGQLGNGESTSDSQDHSADSAMPVRTKGLLTPTNMDITANSKDNLEAQDTGIDARCEPWEIFDPTLQAKGIGGTDAHGGLESSAIGCRRVCYITWNTGTGSTWSNWLAYRWSTNNSRQLDKNGVTEAVISSTNPLIPLTDNKTRTPALEARLLFSTENIEYGHGTDNTDLRLQVNGDRTLKGHPTGSSYPKSLIIAKIKIPNGNDITDDDQLASYVIKVAPNQNYCHLWNTTTDQEVFRSQN